MQLYSTSRVPSFKKKICVFLADQTLAGRVPHEGVSRLVTSSRRQYAEKTVRRGLAMILEHGFMNSAEGKNMYKQNLLQIAQCVQETANHDVVSAYLTCTSYDKEWEKKHGIKQDGVRRMLTEEVNRTACVQKTVYGLDILSEYSKPRAHIDSRTNFVVFIVLQSRM
jgi:hypothetical protein